MASNHGGRRSNSGRKSKPVEDAQRTLISELYDEQAERAVIENIISIARGRSAGPGMSPITAANWLDERKHGKLTERVEQSGETRIIVEYADAETDAT
jgi:hypothetical protein